MKRNGKISGGVRQLSEQFLAPLDGQLARYPKGRKGYNGRVAYGQRWEYFYDALRPHLSYDMAANRLCTNSVT